MREVRVYDFDFSSYERILAGDPTAVFPKEIWLQQVQPGEFAVRYKDFKTGLARNPAGQHVNSSEICRIFSSLEEARANSREVVNDHWTLRCFIYDHTGAQAGTISNNKKVNKHPVVVYAGILLWLGIFALVGMGLIWIVFKIAPVVLGPFPRYASCLSRSVGLVGRRMLLVDYFLESSPIISAFNSLPREEWTTSTASSNPLLLPKRRGALKS